MTQEEFYEAAFTEIKAIEEGKATIELTAGDIPLGRVEYLTNNGWSIIRFSDGDDWDYIDAIIPPSGEHFPHHTPRTPSTAARSMAQSRANPQQRRMPVDIP